MDVTSTRSARSASARTFGSAAASSPETTRSPIFSGDSASSSQPAAQASATPRPFGVRREVEGARARLVAEAELAGERGEMRAAAALLARPDQDRPLARAQLLAERVARCRRDAGSSRPRRRVYSMRGAGAAGGPQPEVDDRRALDDGLVAEHDHELGVADRRERQAEGVERAARRSGRTAVCAPRPRAQELAERVGLLDGLRARERGHDPSSRLAQQPLGLVERVVPGELLEARAAARAGAGRRSGRAA